MTRSTGPRKISPEVTAAVPTQRIVINEAPAGSRPDGNGRPARPGRDGNGRPARPGRDEVAVDLPDFSAVLAGVPGGLGADVVEAFTFAGQRWTAADAGVYGTPIGAQLAMEQRGLDVSDTDHLDLPHQRTAP